MAKRIRYPRTLILFLLMIVFSLTIMGETDSRLNIGGSELEPNGISSLDAELYDIYDPGKYRVVGLSYAGDNLRSYLAQEDDSDNSEIRSSTDQFQQVALEDLSAGQEAIQSAPKNGADTASLTDTGRDTSPAQEPDQDEKRTAEKPDDEERIQLGDAPKESEKEERPTVLVHKVQNGETLWDIARSYNITVDTILAANDIANSNRIRVGQELQILTVKGVMHEVAPGESLWEISQRYRVSMDEIVRANEISDPGTIQPRDKLVIPGATKVLRRDVLVANGTLQKAFDWPTRGRISSPFGPRWGRMHNGIDIAISTGTPLRAAADGRITFSGYNGGYGNLVVIDHGNGVETRYAHNSRNIVQAGQRVSRGQVIAYSGNTGNSTGPHVHFEIRYRGKPVDPMKYLK